MIAPRGRINLINSFGISEEKLEGKKGPPHWRWQVGVDHIFQKATLLMDNHSEWSRLD